LSDNEEGKGLRMRTAASPPDWTTRPEEIEHDTHINLME